MKLNFKEKNGKTISGDVERKITDLLLRPNRRFPISVGEKGGIGGKATFEITNMDDDTAEVEVTMK